MTKHFDVTGIPFGRFPKSEPLTKDRLVEITLDSNERDIIYRAIHMWINYIETGEVWRSANDSKNMGLPSKELNADQVEIIQELRELAKKVLVPNDMKGEVK